MGRTTLPAPNHVALETADGELLARFVAERDEAAFAALVRRHGPLVLGVCRRRLRHAADADDAFQAVFLTLVRRAGDVLERPTLAPWLHAVACRVSANVRRREGGWRRRHGELPAELPARHDLAPRECGAELDAALRSLPERYRTPVLLCHVEGLSRRDAARRLHLKEGTLSAQLARALALLRTRLRGRDPLALLAGAGAALAAGAATNAAQAAAEYRSHEVGAIAPRVLQLIETGGWMMLAKKLGPAVLATLAAAFLAAFAWHALAQTEPPAAEDKMAKELADIRQRLAALEGAPVKKPPAKDAPGAAIVKAVPKPTPTFFIRLNAPRSGHTEFEFEVAEVGVKAIVRYRPATPDDLEALLQRAKLDPAAPRRVEIVTAEIKDDPPGIWNTGTAHLKIVATAMVRATEAACRRAGFTDIALIRRPVEPLVAASNTLPIPPAKPEEIPPALRKPNLVLPNTTVPDQPAAKPPAPAAARRVQPGDALAIVELKTPSGKPHTGAMRVQQDGTVVLRSGKSVKVAGLKIDEVLKAIWSSAEIPAGFAESDFQVAFADDQTTAMLKLLEATRRIKPGDTLHVAFRNDPSGSLHKVGADGTLKLPSGVAVTLAGLLPSDVGAAIVKADDPKLWPKAEDFRVTIGGANPPTGVEYAPPARRK